MVGGRIIDEKEQTSNAALSNSTGSLHLREGFVASTRGDLVERVLSFKYFLKLVYAIISLTSSKVVVVSVGNAVLLTGTSPVTAISMIIKKKLVFQKRTSMTDPAVYHGSIETLRMSGESFLSLLGFESFIFTTNHFSTHRQERDSSSFRTFQSQNDYQARPGYLQRFFRPSITL